MMAIQLDGGIPSRRNGRISFALSPLIYGTSSSISRLATDPVNIPDRASRDNMLLLELATEAVHRQVQNFVSKARSTWQSDRAEEAL
jgi:hypothetical protein